MAQSGLLCCMKPDAVVLHAAPTADTTATACVSVRGRHMRGVGREFQRLLVARPWCTHNTRATAAEAARGRQMQQVGTKHGGGALDGRMDGWIGWPAGLQRLAPKVLAELRVPCRRACSSAGVQPIAGQRDPRQRPKRASPNRKGWPPPRPLAAINRPQALRPPCKPPANPCAQRPAHFPRRRPARLLRPPITCFLLAAACFCCCLLAAARS